MARPRVHKIHKRNVTRYPGEILVGLAELEPLRGRWRKELQRERLWLEIGCGRGAFLSQLRAGHPEAGLLGLELKPDRCVTARNKLRQCGAEGGFRVLCEFAEVLPRVFREGELDRVYMNFPDPWPSETSRRRRLFGERMLWMIQDLLAPGGELRFKSDEPAAWEELLAGRPQNLELLEAGPDLDHSPLAASSPRTEFEELFRRKGLPIHFAHLRKVIPPFYGRTWEG